MLKLICIAVGGACGALARYGTTRLFYDERTKLPWGTLAVNVVGSFLLGYLLQKFGGRNEEWHAGLTVGFLGAMTTFSTFAYETIDLWPLHTRWAIANLFANACCGILAALAGVAIAK